MPSQDRDETPEDSRVVIVLDGPAGAGKSSVAREISRRMGLPFLDTGAIYRAITLVMQRAGIEAEDSPQLRDALRDFYISFRDGGIFVGDEDVSEAIRTPEIDAAVSRYSALPAVRSELLGIQRAQADAGLVAEGRDMGTVVFPDADLKIFLTASPESRARRRYDERAARGESVDYGEILASVNRRDEIDSNRDAAPLRQASDAILLDSTGVPFEEVVDRILKLASGI
ncbi:MAG: (d)CMP kinase [Synergistaceae bacterium]|jgi:cytidylate kinase|nr:(d)CMP kinase [Synergistaceae bacterium]